MSGTHGVLVEEQERAQPFEVDLDLDVDLRPAGVSDALADTVDYGAVADVVAATVSGARSFALLEALAWHVADAVLDVDHRIRGVTVGLRKLRPPAGRRHRHRRGPGGPHPVTVPSAAQPTRRAFLSLGSNLGRPAGRTCAGPSTSCGPAASRPSPPCPGSTRPSPSAAPTTRARS